MKDSQQNQENLTSEPKKKKSILFPIILAIIVLGGGIYGYQEYKYSKNHVNTDDAQISTHMAPVISRISGYVTEVKVQDNQWVHKGDTLVVLDNRDQKMAVMAAEAALNTAKSNIAIAKASTNTASQGINSSDAAVSTMEAQINAAKVNVWKTTQDFQRYANLIKDHSITQQQYDQVFAAKQEAEKQLQVLQQQKKQAQQQVSVAASQTHAASQQIGSSEAMVKQQEVNLANAQLNLSYTVITAPEDGFVAKVPTQPGQFVQAGAQLFSLIHDNQVWVVANFKETQLTKMVIGQKAEIEIDAFPKQKFSAKITSISPGTGSSFSILPPDNASGNFVKVVQRVPVRIDFINLSPDFRKKLRVGMNADVTVSLND